MRLTIAAILSWGCGSQHPPPVDGAPSGTLTVNTYRASGPINTQLLAVQDGDGPWTVLTGAAGVYTTPLSQDRFGVMIACSSTMSSAVYIYYQAVSDGLTLYINDCADPGAPAATIHGSITGAAAANPLRVLDQAFDQVNIPAGTTTYTLPTVAGPTKLIAEEIVANRPIKVAIDELGVVDGATVNFDLASGFAPVTRALAGSAPLIGATLSYRDVHGISRVDPGTSPFDNYRGIPADKLGTGLNRLVVSAGPDALQTVIRYFTNPVDESIAFGPMLQLAAQPVAIKTPYPLVQYTIPVDADTTSYDVNFSTTNGATMTSHSWVADMTKAWVAKAFPGASSLSYTPPDFHALAGWSAAFQLEAGQAIDWNAGRVVSTDMEPYLTVPPTQLPYHDGSQEQIASVTGQLAAP